MSLDQELDAGWRPGGVMRERGEIMELRRRIPEAMRRRSKHQDPLVALLVFATILNTLNWVLGEYTTEQFVNMMAGPEREG